MSLQWDVVKAGLTSCLSQLMLVLQQAHTVAAAAAAAADTSMMLCTGGLH